MATNLSKKCIEGIRRSALGVFFEEVYHLRSQQKWLKMKLRKLHIGHKII
jgi:hypothetical protein